MPYSLSIPLVPPIPSTSPVPHPPYAASSVGKGPLAEILLQTTSAATNRNEEAKLIFENIATVLDDALNEIVLPQHLQKTFREFITDLTAVARRHFESHVRGTNRPSKPYTTENSFPNDPKTRNTAHHDVSTKTQTTYSSAVKMPNQKYSPPAKPSPRPPDTQLPKPVNKSKVLPKKPHEDNRIFVRISPGHTCLGMSPYAIMLQLDAFLKGKFVREVQKIKTGFAICPISNEAHETLVARMSDIEAFLSIEGECKVEKPEQYSAFKLSGIPRSYSGYDGSGIVLIDITANTIAQALTDLTNIPPANVIECQSPTDNQFSDKKNWIVFYPQGSNLSKSLPLFGARISVKLLPKRTKTPQCGNCYGWHNERACSRAPRCRICGSTQHVESNHTTCDPSRSHECPPKCVNCHGPHTADSLECLIRPGKDNKLPTKAQIVQIRKAATAARLRLKTAHCGTLGTETTNNENIIPATQTTVGNQTLDRDTLSTTFVSQNNFAALADNAQQHCADDTMKNT